MQDEKYVEKQKLEISYIFMEIILPTADSLNC